MRQLFCYLLIVISFAGCKKNYVDLQPDVPDNPWPPFIDEKIRTSIQGYITDEHDKPLEYAKVWVGNKPTSTSSEGYFSFEDVEVGKTAGSLVVELPGYFLVTRTFMPVEGSINYIRVQLIPLSQQFRFRSDAGGKIELGNNVKIEIPANSLVWEGTDLAYNGEVSLHAVYLDPADPALPKKMPGNLMGLNEDQTLKQLHTFGMVAVILRAVQGGKLNLAEGKTATVTLPVPASLPAPAPETIPMWFFDDVSGLWREAGVARKEGNLYKSAVAHFSFWNADIPNDFVTLTMKIATKAGALPFHSATITNLFDGATTWGTTDSAGIVRGPVPKNAKLRREIFNFCGGLVYSDEIGPFTVSTDLGDVLVTIPSTHQLTLNGMAKNCAGGAVANGYADIRMEGIYYRALVHDGVFSLTASRCSADFTSAEVTVTDLDANMHGATSKYNVGAGIVNLGNLEACGFALGEYFNFTLADSIHFGYSTPIDSIVGDFALHTSILAFNKDTRRIIAFLGYIANTTIGDHIFGQVHVKNGAMNLGTAASGILSVRKQGGLNEFVHGLGNLSLLDSTSGKIYDTRIEFRVRRQ